MKKKENKKFSVITVCYNVKDKLEKTLNNVLGQVGNNFECIVVDGASTDGTHELLKAYEKKENLMVISEPDKGIYDAMNKGLKACTGEFIIFMNAGDIFDEKDVVEKLSYICNDANAVYYGTSKAVYPNGEIRSNRVYRRMHKDIIGDVFDGRMPNHQAIIAGRKTFENNMFNLSYPITADFNWFARCVKKRCRIVALHMCIARFEVGGASSRPTSSIKMKKEYEDILLREYPIRYRLFCFFNPR